MTHNLRGALGALMKLLIAIVNSFELDEIRNGIVEVGLVV